MLTKGQSDTIHASVEPARLVGKRAKAELAVGGVGTALCPCGGCGGSQEKDCHDCLLSHCSMNYFAKVLKKNETKEG